MRVMWVREIKSYRDGKLIRVLGIDVYYFFLKVLMSYKLCRYLKIKSEMKVNYEIFILESFVLSRKVLVIFF